MNKKQEKEFNKRYYKFKNNSLPTPFWDKERQVLEYVNYYTELDYWSKRFESENDDYDRKLNVNSNLVDALADITSTGFYYSYTCGHFASPKDNSSSNIIIGHTHSHSFEEVVRDLYNFPESFSVSKEEEKYFSKQELDYLKRVKSYLLFIGLKDITTYKRNNLRYRNKNQSKYGIARIITCRDEFIKDIKSGKINYYIFVPDNINIYDDYEEFPNHDFKELLVDKDYNFKIFIEYTHCEIKLYKEVKDYYNNLNLKDNDKVIAEYFKVLEVF